MSPVAVPNVSEGRDSAAIERFVEAVVAAGARVVDVHSDTIHNRSVLTTVAPPDRLADAMAALAAATTSIDLTAQRGVHPRLGGLDVCPFVVDDAPAGDVVALARAGGEAIAERARLPVYLYGYAATRRECEHLPDLRRGGLHGLVERSRRDLPPDLGPPVVDLRRGVVCVGARDVLVAFNVWLRCDAATAREIAATVRADRALAGVRALGFDLGGGRAQVSMNLTEPARTGVDAVHGAVAALAADLGVRVLGTEIVGVPPERFMPDPDAQAARLLIKPGRSLEAALAGE
ncbi:MAG: glutamate formiminotransferase [Actinomycetota bacterium]